MVRDLDAEARVLIGSGKRVGDRKANEKKKKANAGSRDRTSDLQIFSLTLSQLSYTGGMWSDRVDHPPNKQRNKKTNKIYREQKGAMRELNPRPLLP